MRNLASKIATIVSVCGILWHFYVLGVRATAPGILRPVHILFVTTLAVLLFPKPGAGKTKSLFAALDGVLLAFIVGSTAYIIYDQVAWSFRAGMSPTRLDVIFSLATTIAILEFTRRLFGMPLVVLSVTLMAYAALGWYAPGIFKILPYSFERIMGQVYSVDNGIFGLLTGVSATYVLPFLFLGRIMQNSGTGQYFMDLANKMTGRSRGGPAKIAVVSSALFGTISGAGAANVVATGTFTIPLMVRTGYKPSFAAAVESVASTGGQIMPPIMCSAAFLASELTGIPYGTIARAALIPAVLYFTALYAAVDLEAGRLKLAAVALDDLPSWKSLLSRCHLLLPLATIVYMLMIRNTSPLRAGMAAIVTAMIVSWLRRDTRMTPSKLLSSMCEASRDIVPIGVAFAAAGIVVGMLTLTGLGVKLTSLVMSVARGALFLGLLTTMVVTILLGMGLPVAASYVIAASICAPALTEMGVPTLAAHLFVLHFASLSAITPPVALAAYAAAGMARENPLRVAVTACRIGLVAFVVPYMFVYGQGLLCMSGAWLAIRTGLTASLGALAVALGSEGWWKRPMSPLARALLLLGGFLMIETRPLTDGAGLALMALGLAVHRFGAKSGDLPPMS